MSLIKDSLQRLDNAVEMLSGSVDSVEISLSAPVESADNVVDVDFVARRLDNAIAAVEHILQDEE